MWIGPISWQNVLVSPRCGTSFHVIIEYCIFPKFDATHRDTQCRIVHHWTTWNLNPPYFLLNRNPTASSPNPESCDWHTNVWIQLWILIRIHHSFRSKCKSNHKKPVSGFGFAHRWSLEKKLKHTCWTSQVINICDGSCRFSLQKQLIISWVAWIKIKNNIYINLHAH